MTFDFAALERRVAALESSQPASLRFGRGKLAIFDSEENESGDATVEIAKTGAMYSPKSWSFKMSSSDTDYDKAEVSYTDPKTGKTQKATASAQKKDTKKDGKEKTLVINQRVENPDQAQTIARSRLQKKNQSEQTASLECMGNPRLVAGINIRLTGFEEFSGQWCIKTATHKISGSGGYATSLELSAPSLTEDGKTESFTREAGENAKSSGSQAPDAPALTYEELIAKVHATGNEIDKLIICLPAIAMHMAENSWNDANKQGWLYLYEMFLRWLSGKKNSDPYANPDIFWVDIEWALKYERVKISYNILSHSGYLCRDAAKLELEKILRADNKFSPMRRVYFDYTNTGYMHWQQDCFQRITVTGHLTFPEDGLLAAMGDFSLCALAKGYTEPFGDKYIICVTGISIFILDTFNFQGDPFYGLGYWRCNPPEFSIFGNEDGIHLSNENFRNFSEKFEQGQAFVVLSKPKRVDPFKGYAYETTI